MIFLAISELIILLAIVGYIMWEYSHKDVPIYGWILTYISMVLSFCIVILLPIDIYIVNKLSLNYN